MLCTVLLAGCGQASGSGPRAAVERFAAAWAQRDGSAVCRLLAPRTRTEVAKSAKQPCAQAILDEDLPPAGSVAGAEVWGGAAQVRTSGDTLFLAEFPEGWRVVAAGCRPHAGAPYDCQVQGG
ncbi:MAG: hypothetical protein QOE19_3927 [Actinomycetota bacterium]|nr:hypothetical protein [Actinomycetota bacterium]